MEDVSTHGRPDGDARDGSPAVLRRPIACYVAIGDSFTAGPEGKAVNGRWADDLADMLRDTEPALAYHNIAVAGAKSREVADGQLARALELEADMVTIVCGANDVLFSVRPDIRAYAATLAEMFRRLATELPECAVLTATTPDFSSFMNLRPRSRERVGRGMTELNEATRRVARSYGVPCLEFAGNPQAGVRENFAGDGIHASRDGNRKAAALIAGVLADRFGFSPLRQPPLEPE